MPGENLTWAFAVLASGLTLYDLCNHPGQADFTTPVLIATVNASPTWLRSAGSWLWPTLRAATLLTPTFAFMAFLSPLSPLLPPLTFFFFLPRCTPMATGCTCLKMSCCRKVFCSGYDTFSRKGWEQILERKKAICMCISFLGLPYQIATNWVG